MRKPAWLVALASLILAGCQSLAGEEKVGIPARVVNADKSISINWARFNGQGASGSGGDECCISIPAKWRPGMMAMITWQKDPSPELNPGNIPPPKWKNGSSTPEWREWMRIHESNYQTLSKTIEVSKYGDDTCGMTFVFLPCDDVRVIIDCEQKRRIFGTLPSGPGRYPELVRRLGGNAQCHRAAV
ncbi:DUF3304 domain-containing protein [Chromobacterium vaccinii]|uniref:DUF3304 domain-containing protein n=1 Tax=Chromobacterium piscinae TaxID=686831 RepID=UPI0014084AB1|nr:DUF3304 domain-containing protein [Chromobacterium vaccinii]MBX9358966.1 DUF3304 domain-containing protein [Chromobacterium vaccinii]NHQ82456.1 DUF3304 domain-containing protein [Chromobacterium vaccinii]